MKFWEALKCLEEGKKIYRKHYSSGIIKNNLDMAEFLSDSIVDEIESHLLAEWEIYQEPEKTYSFMEILPLLKQGKKFRRKNWCAICLWLNNNNIIFLGLENKSIGESYKVLMQDIEADDWVEVHD